MARHNPDLTFLASSDDLLCILEKYDISDELSAEVRLLGEVRNEILHPVHRTTGTSDNWPDYLRCLKDKGLLESTGKPESDYALLAQIESHRLFEWACDVTRNLANEILKTYTDVPWLISFADNYLFVRPYGTNGSHDR